MEKKYILTDETIKSYNGIVLHRIKAIRSFNNVNVGDLGGWIQKEDNLSHEGDCWIYGNATVYGNAIIYGNAIVCDNASVFDDATVYDNAKIYDNAIVYGNATVFGNAKVFENATVFGDATVYDNATVFGDTTVYDNAIVYGNATVFGDATVYDNACVFDDAILYRNACVRGDAVIQSNNDYIVFKNWWSSGRYFTWTRSNNMWCVGHFYGTGDELVKKAHKDSEISGREYERIVKYVESILKDEEK
jgi:carbonic anhydrase/acetyltransferase-like protein (isoleucine patch superfamily)